MSAIAVASLAMLGAWGWSYANNKALISSAGAAIEDYRSPPRTSSAARRFPAPSRFRAATSGRIASYLAQLRIMPAGYAQHDEATPLGEGFGLEQRDRLLAASEVTYRNALERMLRSRLILRLEQQITDSMSDPIVVYEALKVYLMLGGKAPKVEDDFVVAWMTQDWEDNLLPARPTKPRATSSTRNLQDMLRAWPLARSDIRAQRRRW